MFSFYDHIVQPQHKTRYEERILISNCDDVAPPELSSSSLLLALTNCLFVAKSASNSKRLSEVAAAPLQTLPLSMRGDVGVQ